jgi:hypothetical protein
MKRTKTGKRTQKKAKARNLKKPSSNNLFSRCNKSYNPNKKTRRIKNYNKMSQQSSNATFANKLFSPGAN